MDNVRTSFDSRKNSLNVLRLVLALLVVVSHSWPTGGYGPDPQLGGLNLGTWAVAGFFVISGFLITMSRMRSRSLFDFLVRRILRIYPAFIVALAVVAFGFAPLSTLFSGDSYSVTSAVTYVLKNLSLIIFQGDVASTLSSTPIPHVWNGSLWTLKWEFLCYLAIGVVVTLIPKAAQTAVVLGIFVVCTFGTAIQTSGAMSFGYNAGQLLQLGTFFAAGSVVYLMGAKIRTSSVLAGAALGALLLLSLTGTAGIFAGLPLAFLLIWAAIKLPLSRLGSKNDISYGMYIYAFPVQQILANLFPDHAIPVVLFIILAMIATLPFAYGSWFLVERPSMRLKQLTARSRVDGEGHVQRLPGR